MRVYIFGFLMISLVACSPTLSKIMDVEKEATAIKAVMAAQEKAWTNGDINAFMNGYWNSEELQFIGSRGLTHGWETTLDNYKKGYPNKEAMGKLTFDILKLKPLNNNYFYMVGRYQLQRENDKPSGYFTLLWEKNNGEWKIISDHTSG